MDFAKKVKRWAQLGFPELGDLVGMGIGENTASTIRQKKFTTDPHGVRLDIIHSSCCPV